MLYHIEKEESEKIQFLKLVFCIMVVFIHSYTTEVGLAGTVVTVNDSAWLEAVKYITSQIIARCAVPGFFLISAVLLYRKVFTWRENIKRKIQSLLVPYILLNTFWIAFFYVVSNIRILNIFFTNKLYRVSQWGIMEWTNAYLGMSGCPILYPLWFLRDLFVLNILAKAIKLVIDKFPKMWLGLIAAALIFNIESRMFFLSTEALAFFSLGYYIVKYDLHFKDLEKIPAVVVAFIYIGLVTANYLTRTMQVHMVFCALSNGVGIVFWAVISSFFVDRSYKSKLFWAAKYNFSMYLFHEFVLTMLKKIWFKIFLSNRIMLEMAYFLLPLCILLFCLVLSSFLEKLMPKFYSILTGDRKQ